jgi:hypothetical protein
MLVVSDILDAYLPLPEDLLGTHRCTAHCCASSVVRLHGLSLVHFIQHTHTHTHTRHSSDSFLYFLITSKSVGVPRVYWHFVGRPSLHVQRLQGTGRYVRSFKMHTFNFQLSSFKQLSDFLTTLFLCFYVPISWFLLCVCLAMWCKYCM